MRIEASWAASVVEGRLIGDDVAADGIAFDSRVVSPHQAFVALVGDADGHEFVADAAARGAAWALVGVGRAVDFLPCVEVDDTLRALAILGRRCRQRLTRANGRIVGVTGSAGKTTTKNFLHAVLSVGFPGAVSAQASLNNDIGVPVTLINAPEDAPAVVLEMGMRGFGEISRLCDIATPDISVVTNVGDAHSERVGGIDGVARAKGEIVSALSSNGIAILNADDDRVRAMASLHSGAVVTFGSVENADVRWSIIDRGVDGRATVRFAARSVDAASDVDVAEVELPLPGDHMASNAAAAVAVGLALGMPLSDAVTALRETREETGRVQWRTHGSLRILDDSYNANSTSMIAALRTLAAVQGAKRFAVLGAMAEVSDSVAAHQQIAQLAVDLGIDVLPLETDLYGSAPLDVERIVEHLASHRDAVVLVKGSRVSRTERVIDALLRS